MEELNKRNRYINFSKIEIPVYVADRPLDCVANGTGKTIEDMDKLRTALIRK